MVWERGRRLESDEGKRMRRGVFGVGFDLRVGDSVVIWVRVAM